MTKSGLFPESKVHGANMGPTWVLSAPDGPNVGPMNIAIRVFMQLQKQRSFKMYFKLLIVVLAVSVPDPYIYGTQTMSSLCLQMG